MAGELFRPQFDSDYRGSDRPIAALLCSFVTIGVLSQLGHSLRYPFIFPALGPTVLVMFLSPSAISSQPGNVICGHGIAILCGYASLWIFGLADSDTSSLAGGGGREVWAAALSVGLAGGAMVLTRCYHPPAASTTLIISLGVIRGLPNLLAIEVAVIVAVILAISLHRLCGVTYPRFGSTSRR
jgi:CBS-domain-containing membrane protein